MRDWKESFRQTASEFIQRRYDEEHGYVSIPMDPPEPMGMASVILMLPVGIFLFLNGFVFLVSGFRRFIRFFPDNLIMILIILAAVVAVILLKARDARKLREYNAEKNRLADLSKALDELAKDHPEVPRWWHDIPGTGSREYSAGWHGKIRHTSLQGAYFFLNRDQEEADADAEQVRALLSKKDRFYILTENGDAGIREGGAYRICQAEVSRNANFRRYGKRETLGPDDFRLMPRPVFERVMHERDRQVEELIRYIDDISPKAPGESGLSEQALATRNEMERIGRIVRERLEEHYREEAGKEYDYDYKFNKYDVVLDCCKLGYAVYEKGNTEKPVAYALYRNVKDVRHLRLYMQASVTLIDPDDPRKYEKMTGEEDGKKAYNFVSGSLEVPETESGWKTYLRLFLERSCGWIGTDFTEQPRWGLDRGDWSAFILSHVERP